MVCLKPAVVKLLPKRYSQYFILPLIRKNGWQEGFIEKWGLVVFVL